MFHEWSNVETKKKYHDHEDSHCTTCVYKNEYYGYLYKYPRVLVSCLRRIKELYAPKVVGY